MSAVAFDRGRAGLFRALIALVGLAAIAWAAIGLASGASAEELHVLELAIAERQLASPDKTLRVREGEVLEFRVSSDETAELHVHGYDLLIPLVAGETTVTRLPADVAGRFPISLHEPVVTTGHSHRHKRLLYLEVHPR